MIGCDILSTGKLGNHNSESKCLCNLASAQTQLDRLQEATVTFSNALAVAHQAGNTYLQFQACEGLGSIQLQWGRHGEALCYFKQALGFLDHVHEDSGIARERIMGKLSVAVKLLEQIKRAMQEEEVSEGKYSDSEMKLEGLGREENKNDKEGVSNVHVKRVTRSRGTEFATTTLSPSYVKTMPRVPSLDKVENNRARLPLRERRGFRRKLPSLHTSGSQLQPTPPSSAHIKTASRLSPRDKERLQQHPTNSDSTNFDELQAYMDTYKHASPDDNDDSDFKTPIGGPSPNSIPGSTQGPVKEGSLAIGVQAREKFKVQTVEQGRESGNGKRAKGHHRKIRNEIVSTSTASAGVESTLSEEQEGSGDSEAQARTKQSKICTIL